MLGSGKHGRGAGRLGSGEGGRVRSGGGSVHHADMTGVRGLTPVSAMVFRLAAAGVGTWVKAPVAYTARALVTAVGTVVAGVGGWERSGEGGGLRSRMRGWEGGGLGSRERSWLRS